MSAQILATQDATPLVAARFLQGPARSACGLDLAVGADRGGGKSPGRVSVRHPAVRQGSRSAARRQLLEEPMTNNRRPTIASAPRLGWVLGLTSTAYFMVVLDSSVVLTALPRMQHNLHADVASLQWTVNAYGIAFAAGIITAAALGDRFGRRRIFNLGLTLFTLASAACALAPDVAGLVAARTVQGLGAAA